MKKLLLLTFALIFSNVGLACYSNYAVKVNACKRDYASWGPGWKTIICDFEDPKQEDIIVCGPEVYNNAPGECYGYDREPLAHYRICPEGSSVPGPASGVIYKNIGPKACGSIVHVDTETFSEVIPVSGAPFDLVYTSDRVSGRKSWNHINIPLTSANFVSDPSINSIDLKILIAGRTIDLTFPPSPNLNYNFLWDGLDQNGIAVNGTTDAKVLVSVDYNFQTNDGLEERIGGDILYRSIPDPNKTGQMALETMLIGRFDTFPTASKILSLETNNLDSSSLYRDFNSSKVTLGTIFNSQNMIHGWDISIRHHYDSKRDTLFMGNGQTLRAIPLPQTNGDYWVTSPDRSEVFVFDSNDKHVQTKFGLTGYVKFNFSYDSQGRLLTVEDSYGKVTTFVYNSNGLATITAPFGHVTNISLDSNSYISTVTNPASETHEMEYSSSGLMTSFQKPAGNLSSFTYDSNGNLVSDINSEGSEVNLAKTISGSTKTITKTSATSKVTSYVLAPQASSGDSLIETYPDGSKFLNEDTSNLSKWSQYFTSFAVQTYRTVDSRLKTFRPSQYYATLPGISHLTSVNETANLTDPADIFSISTLTKTIKRNYKTYTQSYNASSKTWTETSPVGRVNATVIDEFENLVSYQQGSFTPVTLSYDQAGRLSTIAQGTNRNTILTYDATTGFLSSIKNALNQITSYTYDLAGRIKTQVLPDSRVINYSYDVDGNLISLTPPGKEAHQFDYNGYGYITNFTPPLLPPASQSSTLYTYDNDRKLASVTRPDSQAIQFNYNNTSGVLDSITLPNGFRSYTWANGKLSRSVSEDQIARAFYYNGPFISTDASAIGNLDVTINNGFNDSLLQASETLVTGVFNWNINYTYDDDSLLTAAGNAAYTRSPSTGLITQTDLRNFSQFFGYSSTFGELSSIEAVHNGNDIYSETMTRDNLGRISTMTETYGNGTPKTFSYIYDVAGRLSEVKLNGSTISKYNFDSNSNRIGQTINGETLSGGQSSNNSKAGQLDVGNAHTCSIINSDVKCWGRGAEGQLGYGNTRNIGNDENLTNLGSVSLGNTAKQIELGIDFSCALLTDGSVRCWGLNGVGQLGQGNTNKIGDNEVPSSVAPVNIGGPAKLIAVGYKHACAVTTSNEVVCWGEGTGGRLGYGNQNNIGDDEIPASAGVVNTGVTSEIIQISAGTGHTCVLTVDGNMKCWGANGSRQLGRIGTAIGDNEAPATISFIPVGESVKQIAAGGSHTCALTQSKKVKCWGQNDWGQVGLASTSGQIILTSTLGNVDVGADVKYLTAGNDTTCVITVNDETKCWGKNNSGQLGLGNLNTIGDDETPASVPSINTGGASVIVAINTEHTCALQTSGSVLCWGIGSGGRLGYGNTNTIGDNEVPNAAGTIPGVNLGATQVAAAIEYDAQDRLLKFGTKAFTYNANGDLLTEVDTDSTKNFTYDVFGNLKQVVLPSKTIKYLVDASNRRVARKVNGTAVAYYIWNTENQLIGITDGSGVLQARFIYGSKSHVPDYMTKNNVDYQIVTNHLGSPVAVVDSDTGTVAQEVVWDEWGNIVSDSNPGFTPFGYAGCLYDVDTKLCRFGARDYDASIGRWLSKDPIHFNGGDTNLYGYVLQDPINLIDPNGLYWHVAIGAAIGALPGLIAGDYQAAAVGAASGALGSAKMVGAGLSAIIGAGSSLAETYMKGGSFSSSDTYAKALISGGASFVGTLAGGALRGAGATQIENLKFGLTRTVLRREVNQGLKVGVGGAASGLLDLTGKRACGLD